jgi:hypothetical protein
MMSISLLFFMCFTYCIWPLAMPCTHDDFLAILLL